MKDPHQNIFFYYRGQQPKKEKIDYQIENNVTKSFINLLEFSSPKIRNKILNSLGYPSAKTPVFNLQVCGNYSVPDALIKYEQTRIIIESKVQAPLDLNQLKNHLKKEKGTLLVLTKNSKDKKMAESIKGTKFFTWKEITEKISEIKSMTEKDSFLLSQFIEFMEVMGLSSFRGFGKEDFDAFLNIEEDPTKERREVVKKKFKVFSEELFDTVKKSLPFKKPKLVPIGNLNKESKGVWAAIYDSQDFRKNKQEKELPSVQTIHYSLYLDKNGIQIELWSEGQISNKKLLIEIKNNPKKFTELCKKLKNHKVRLDAKWMIRQRKKAETTIALLETGKYFQERDTEYLIQKIEEQHLFQFAIQKKYSRDYNKLNSKQFLNEIKQEIKTLNPMHKFLCKE